MLIKVIKRIISEIADIVKSFTFYLYNYWVTYVPIHIIRKSYLKYLMNIHVGNSSFVHLGCIFYPNVYIGDNSVIGRQCHLLGNITIQNNVSITAQTYMFTSSHYKNSKSFEAFTLPIVIHDYAWVGARAMICPGVIIGRGAILGAASTATKNIEEYAIFAGAPAKNIGKRTSNLTYQHNYFPYFQ
jgi:acetyltransferase-like isoleucine patch superfamily enzyme